MPKYGLTVKYQFFIEISQISCFVKNGLDIDINSVYFITKELFLDFEF